MNFKPHVFGSRLAVLLLCLSLAGFPQNEGVPRLKLVVQKEVRVKGDFKGPIQDPIGCDQQGRIYVRPYRPIPEGAPVLRFSSDGEHEATFSLQNAPGFEKGRASLFAITPRGEVYFVAAKALSPRKFEIALVGFDEDARHASTVRLGENFVASQIASFPTGEFLVSGWTSTSEAGKEPAAVPFTASFDIRGRPLNRLGLPDDVRDESENTEGQEPKALVSAVDLGDAAVGLDGNIYLMRRTAKPLVYVVSPLGELVRRFEVTPPEEKAQPAGLIYGPDGLLVFQFDVIPEEKEAEHKQIFSLVNPETGERIRDYESPIPGFHPLACYAPGDFTIFTWDQPDFHHRFANAVPH